MICTPCFVVSDASKSAGTGHILILEWLLHKLDAHLAESSFRTACRGMCIRVKRSEIMSFLILFILWIMWNGKFTVEIGMLGLVICAALYLFISRFMGYSLRTEREALKCLGKAARYLLFLLAEIIKANLDVAKMILAYDIEPEPVLARFNTDLHTETGRVILANSITLTPGTLTVYLHNGEYLVHCLDEGFAEGMEQSEFIERIRGMEHPEQTQDSLSVSCRFVQERRKR